MRIKQIAAFTFVVALGSLALSNAAQAQGTIGPGYTAAGQIIEEPSTLPAGDVSFASNWRLWSASIMWMHGLQSPSPIRLAGAAAPVDWRDRRWRLR